MQAKTSFPMEIITGIGLGISYSSSTQIGALLPATRLGAAGLDCYANIATGNLIVFDRPLHVEACNFPLHLQYIYNSQAEKVEDIWRLSLKQFKQPFVQAFPPESLTLIEEDGHETTYSLLPNSEEQIWVPPLWGKKGRPFLRYDEEQQEWALFHPETQITEYFDTLGRLSSRTDALARETTYSYASDNSFTLSQITEPSGACYQFIRETDGVHTTITCKANRPFEVNPLPLQQWIFDNQNRLVQTKIFGQTVDLPPYTIHYSYDARLGFEKNLLAIEQPDKSMLIFEYLSGHLSKARLGEESLAFGFDAVKNACTVVNEQGFAQYFSVDIENQLVRLERQAGLTGDAAPWVQNFAYLRNQLSSIINPNGSTEQYTYDAYHGRLTKYEHSEGLLKEYFYDDQKGYLLIAEAESIDETQAITRYVYEENVFCLSQKKGKTGRTLRFKISPEGRTEEYRYEAKGDLASIRTYFEFCLLGNTAPLETGITLEHIKLWLNEQNPSDIHLTTYLTNAFGQRMETKTFTKVEDGEGVETEDMGFLYEEWAIGGAQLKTTEVQKKGEKPAITAYTLDALERPLTVTDPLSHVTRYEYEEECANNESQYTTTEPNGRQEVRVKDVQGRIVRNTVQVPDGAGFISRQTKLQWSEDKISILAKTAPNGLTSYYLYDCQNQLHATISPDGLVSQILYDGEKRFRTSITYAKAMDCNAFSLDTFLNFTTLNKADSANKIAYAFLDGLDRVRYTVDALGSIEEMRYNHRSQIIAKIRYANPVEPSDLAALKEGKSISLAFNPEKDRTTRMFYDKDGLLLAKQDAAGFITEYKRNGAGFILTTITYRNALALDLDREDFNQIRPPMNKTLDAYEYFLNNNRGDCIIHIDAERYVTSNTWLANRLLWQTRRYAKALDLDSEFKAPNPSAEDEFLEYSYDLRARKWLIHHINDGFEEIFAYDVQDNLTMQAIEDSQASALNGDTCRATYYRFNGFDEKIATAPPLLAEKIIAIHRNNELAPESKAALIEDLWAHFSERQVLDDKGLLLSIIKSQAATDCLVPKDTITYIYYDVFYRPILSITQLDSTRVLIEEKSLDIFDRPFRKRTYAQEKRSFPPELIPNLKGGILDETLRALLNDLQDDENDPVETMEYNHADMLAMLTDAEGFPTVYIPNAFGEIIEEQRCLSNKVPELFILTELDNRGLVVEKRKKTKETTLILEQKAYDHPLKRCTKHIDALGCQREYTPDKLGRVIEEYIALEEISTRYGWDAFDRITEKTDALEHVWRIEYLRKSHTRLSMNPNGETYLIEINNIFGALIEKMDALGHADHYQHNAMGSLIKHLNPLMASDESTYNLSNQRTLQENALGAQIAYILDGLGKTTALTQNAYFGKKSIVAIETQYKRNGLNRISETINAEGILTQRVLDKRGAIKKEVIDASVDGLNLVKTTTYNGVRQPTAEYLGDAQDPYQQERQFLIDEFGRPTGENIDPKGLAIETEAILNPMGQKIAIIHPDKSVSWQIYNVLGKKCFEIDPMGGVKEWVYNKLGQVITAITYDSPLTGLNLNPFNPSFLPHKNIKQDTVIHYFYDSFGRERFEVKLIWDYETEALRGIVQEKRYDAASQNTEIIDYNSTISASNIAHETVASLEVLVSQIASPKKDAKTRMIYDADGQLRFTINAEGYVHERRYDALGQLITEIAYAIALNPEAPDLLKAEEVYSYLSADATLDRYHYRFYDALKRLVFEINGENAVTGYSFDAIGNQTEVCRYAKTLPIPAEYQNLIDALSDYQSNRTKDRVTSYHYDANKRLIKVIDPMGYEESYAYDALGNMKKKTDKMNTIWTFEWDKANRELKKVAPKVPVTVLTLTEDGHLREKETVMAHPVTQKTYNKQGAISSITLGAGTKEERIIEMGYNPCGKLASTTRKHIPIDNKTPIVQGYRPETPSTITTGIVYNTRQKKVGVFDESGLWTYYIRDNSGHWVYKIAPNGAVTYRRRDSQGFVVKETKYAALYKSSCPPVMEDLVQFFKEQSSKEDRTTIYIRDRLGKVISTLSGDVYDVLSLSSETTTTTARTQARKDFTYNGFGEIIGQDSWLNSQDKHTTLFWFNRAGKKVFEAETLSASKHTLSWKITYHEHNVFHEHTKEHLYANPWTGPLDTSMPASLLKKTLSTLINAKDRISGYVFNQNGWQTEEHAYGVTRQNVVLSPSGSPELADVYYLDLVKSKTEFNPKGLPITITDAMGNKQHKFYDAQGTLIAETGPTQTNAGLRESCIPLTYYGQNIHGQIVKTQRFKKGAKPVTDINLLPIPIAEDREDQISYHSYEKRGKKTVSQDAAGNLKDFGYTATGEISREWQKATYFKQSATHKGLFAQEPALDIKAYRYDALRQPIQKSLLRNNELQSTIFTEYNAFQQEECQYHDPLDKADKTHYNTLGYPWFQMKNGVPTIHFHDLGGQSVYEADSSICGKIEGLTYETLPTVLTWSVSEIERTEKLRDLQGRLSLLRQSALQVYPKNETDLLVSQNRTLVYPEQRFEYDLFNNHTKMTDALGNETLYEWNEADKCIKETLIPVGAWSEHGTFTPDFRRKMRYGYDLSDRQIGESWNLSNGQRKTKATLFDAVHPIVYVLPDGTKERTLLWNALGQNYEERDARGCSWKNGFDTLNNICVHTTPLGFTTRWLRNEKSELIASIENTQSSPIVWRYHWDVHGNIDEIYTPMYQKTMRIFDARHNLLREVHPDGRQSSWKRNYFGLPTEHTDLSGGLTHFIYNGKGQLAEHIRTGGNRWAAETLEMETDVILRNAVAHIAHTTNKEPEEINQHMTYSYALGQVVSYTDEIRRLTNIYLLNKRGEREGLRLYNRDSHELLRRQDCQYDGLGRELWVQDDSGCYTTGYDDENNRRYVRLEVRINGTPYPREIWWGYHDNGWVTRSGLLINGVITPQHHDQFGSGFIFGYTSGYRTFESIKNASGQMIDAHIAYDNDGRLYQTDYSTLERVVRGYDGIGRLETYQQRYGNNYYPLLSRGLQYNANSRMTYDGQDSPGKRQK